MDDDVVADLLGSGLERWSVPGAQVGLLRGGDRRVTCAGVLGVDDPTPVTPGTAFHAGSITKSLVGLVVLDAARRGLLDLDESCARQGGAGLWQETPREILAQTTGRPNLLPDLGEDLEAFVARTAALPLVHEPGRFSYCNAGWSALDLLLRRRTGRGFEQAAQDLLGPLQFGVPHGAAHGHQVAPGQPPVAVAHDDYPVASAPGARWFAHADALLDYAYTCLGHGGSRVHADDLAALRRPTAAMPGHTVFDGWSLGFGVWQRGAHQAFGWAGYTSGHRTYLRCFPEQDAALVVLTSCAGPLLGPPGGAALFDELLPTLLETLGVPALADPEYGASRPAAELAGQYGPLGLTPDGGDGLLLDAGAFGVPQPVACPRLGGDTFTTSALGGMPFAVDGDLLYLGPFAMPRTG